MRSIILAAALFALPAFASQTPCTNWQYEYDDGGAYSGGPLADGGYPAGVIYTCHREPYSSQSAGCTTGGGTLLPVAAALAALLLRRSQRRTA